MSFLTALIPLIPALLSAVSGGASAALSKGPKLEKLDTLNPQQQSVQKMILDLFSGQGGQMGGAFGEWQKLLSGGPGATEDFEKPLMRQFNEQIVPGLAERFSGAGAGAQNSSAFQQALGGAGADLSERLGSIRAGSKRDALSQLISLWGPAMQSSFDYTEKEERNPWKDFLGGFGGGASRGLGQMTPQLAQKYWMK